MKPHIAYLTSLQAKVNALRELQSASGEELSALMPSPSVASGMPSVVDRAFKGSCEKRPIPVPPAPERGS
jgi:hypothetical protein